MYDAVIAENYLKGKEAGIAEGKAESRAEGKTDNVYEYGFGVVALIAMTPIIAIQILGIIQQIKSNKAYAVMRKHVYSIEDAQIINF